MIFGRDNIFSNVQHNCFRKYLPAIKNNDAICYCFFVLFIIFIFSSCYKNPDPQADCAANTATVRQLTDGAVIIKRIDNKFYIVEQGTIDKKLSLRSIAEELKKMICT